MTTARSDFQQRIGRRSRSDDRTGDSALPTPGGVRAQAGAGQVTLTWEPVAGAVGYVLARADDGSEDFRQVDHGGLDVLALPGPPYADTTGVPGRRYRYTVAALADLECGPGARSEPVEAEVGTAAAEPLVLEVHADQDGGRLRRLWHMIGSERLSQLLAAQSSGCRPIAEEFEAALRIARDELGVRTVRAHAILHDDLGVYRNGGGPDFTRIDEVYDRLLGLGLRPVVEVSFVPAALASDASATVFTYGAVVSPPRDWDRWGELVGALAQHLVRRYGVDEVAGWGFEVWNEPNLEVFWTGTQAEYFRLYSTAARAVKAVDERLLVGGPATAAAGWIGAFLDHVGETGAPLDFVSTHTYGNVVLDVREALRVRGMEQVAVWWTEWGITPQHFSAVNDSALGAPFVLWGMKRAQDSADALAYWVVSDHFEELGRPPSLRHGGFGLLSVGNLRKPRFWALALAEQLGDDLCAVTLSGDGAGSLVDAWASRTPDGRVDVLAWNGTLDQSKAGGDELLDRRLALRVRGLPPLRHRLSVARVDAVHSAVLSRWPADRAWPEPDEWAALAAADRLHSEDLGEVEGGEVTLQLDLPMPGVLRLRLVPQRGGSAAPRPRSAPASQGARSDA